MKTARLMAAGALIGAFLSATFCAAGPFEKEFKLKSIVGTCTVTMPDGKTSAAEEGKAYPYGATITTGRKSSAVLELSSGNEVRILANATLKADQKAEDASDKTIRLREGRIQVKLQEDFHKTNKFVVETPTAVCGAIGCEFSVETRDKGWTKVEVVDGKVILSGTAPDGTRWSITLKSGDSATVTQAGESVTITNDGGKAVLKYTGIDGTEQTIELASGSKFRLGKKKDESGLKTLLEVKTTSGTTATPVGEPGP